MATFLRRKLGKLMEKDVTPPSMTITRPEGGVVLTKKELQRYAWLFAILDRSVVIAADAPAYVSPWWAWL